MITTRGWGGAGGLVTVQGFGGFFVESRVSSLALSPQLQGLLAELYCATSRKVTLADFQAQMAEQGVLLTAQESDTTDLGWRLRKLETNLRVYRLQRRTP